MTTIVSIPTSPPRCFSPSSCCFTRNCLAAPTSSGLSKTMRSQNKVDKKVRKWGKHALLQAQGSWVSSHPWEPSSIITVSTSIQSPRSTCWSMPTSLSKSYLKRSSKWVILPTQISKISANLIQKRIQIYRSRKGWENFPRWSVSEKTSSALKAHRL